MTKQTGMIFGGVLAGICIIAGGIFWYNKNNSKAEYQTEKNLELEARNEQFGGKTKRRKHRKTGSKKRR